MALISSLASGVSALKSFSDGLEVIGSNIANVNSYGYKTSRANYADNFSNMLSKATLQGGPVTSQIGTGVNVSSISSDFSQGTITSTGVVTDLAIDGNGFFKVIDPLTSAEYVTRSGNFFVKTGGDLVDPNGFNVQGLTGGSIAYTVTEVAGELVYTPTKTAPTTVGDINLDFDLGVGSGITVDASVTSFSNAEVEAAVPTLESFGFDKYGNAMMYMSNGDSFSVGKVLMLDFSNPNALESVGGNLFANLDVAGPTNGTTTLTAAENSAGIGGFGTFKTESLELSNVDLTDEMASLITTQRSFQAGSRIISVTDDVLQEVVNLKR